MTGFEGIYIFYVAKRTVHFNNSLAICGHDYGWCGRKGPDLRCGYKDVFKTGKSTQVLMVWRH
jgi:hypothetical protein